MENETAEITGRTRISIAFKTNVKKKKTIKSIKSKEVK